MKTVIITGGSRGIGAAAVRAFCARGDRVAFLYEKEDEKAQAVAAETGAQAVRCDVADEARVTEALSAIPDVDVLINNAGIAHYGLINQITPEQWRRIFAVHVDGAFYCIRAVLPSMLAKQHGCIINVSSMWGQVGASCEVAYSAAKAGLIGLSKSVAKELGSRGVCCNCIAPGFIETAMTKDIKEDNPLLVQVPMRKMGTPEDVANVALFLASPESDYITGETIRVDGGLAI